MLSLSYKKLFKKLVDIDLQHNELMQKVMLVGVHFMNLRMEIT